MYITTATPFCCVEGTGLRGVCAPYNIVCVCSVQHRVRALCTIAGIFMMSFAVREAEGGERVQEG